MWMPGRRADIPRGVLALPFVLAAFLAACAGNAPPPTRDEAHAPPGVARVEVAGFHTALFGMDAAQVRDTIVQDYHVAPAAIRSEENAAEKTQILAVTVPDLLPSGGSAEIAYVFGFTSRKLVQIGVTWSTRTDPALTPERLMRNARLLAEHFKEAGYRPDSIATDVPLADGMLVFRGTDKAGHATLLTLQEPPADVGRGAKPPPPTALTLYYIADPQRPDVEAPAPVEK